MKAYRVTYFIKAGQHRGCEVKECKPPDTLKPDYSHTKNTEPRPNAPQIITATHRGGFFLLENVGAELDKT